MGAPSPLKAAVRDMAEEVAPSQDVNSIRDNLGNTSDALP